jgi:hypothetical protein
MWKRLILPFMCTSRTGRTGSVVEGRRRAEESREGGEWRGKGQEVIVEWCAYVPNAAIALTKRADSSLL